MLVFGAGTNYALLLISRYREELQRTDNDRAALATAWRNTVSAILASTSRSGPRPVSSAVSPCSPSWRAACSARRSASTISKNSACSPNRRRACRPCRSTSRPGRRSDLDRCQFHRC
ncbi:MMPL family transporter [Bowdeniella nasicola]|uniref:MMPL family transporter n=1 Tax=Bowdeniella nasicola TaxID=208480 RepID=UPI003CCBF444